MGAAIAVIIRKQREIMEVFEGARATSPATARDPDELGIDESMVFHGLVRRAVLRDAGGGRYYIDQPSWRAMNDMRRQRILIIGGILVALAALVLGLVISRV